MSFRNLYLLWFAHDNLNFRLPEIESILEIFKIEVKWVEAQSEKPFWVAEFNSEEDVHKLASRSITLRSILKLWGSGETEKKLHENIKSYPKDLIAPYISSDISFRVEVVSFGKSFTMKEKVEKIEKFNYLPVNGTVNLKNPDIILFYIEYYGIHPQNVYEQPYSYYFGVWITDAQRALISKYSLKRRKFIGNTSMDPQLSLLMANQALVKKGDLVMDPFVGTGSLLAAAAEYGGYVMGVDIDFLMLHGKTRPSRKQDRFKARAIDESIYTNMKQYGTGSQYLDVVIGDSSLPLWHERLKFDSIITDPPYGIREATERIGTTKDYKISEKHLKGHIPSKINYCLTQIFKDLLNFSVKHLKTKGRLVSWIPVLKQSYSALNLPHHPCLRLIANSEQSLNDHTSRRLLTWEKVREVKYIEEIPVVPEMFPFRDSYFGREETRKQRKMRVAQELKDKGITYCPRRRGEGSDR